MFKKILIANRGEIALRLARTAKILDIEPIFVYEQADSDLPHAKAKNAHKIHSYTDPDEIVKVAKQVGAEAIHPGYGFISENPDFVLKTNEASIEFIGPSHKSMARLGNKQYMLKSAKIAGIPPIPGIFLSIDNLEKAYEEAEKIGYPVIAKGKESGGGRQIKLLQNSDDLDHAINRIKKTEDVDEIYIAKFLTNVKHIEVQLLGDKNGDVVSLGTRDCSIQRRFQKLIEEAPSTVPVAYRQAIENSAINIAHLADYTNACTIEFLLDEHGKHYFMEVNPRLQVEHCVTEEIFNVDIVKNQFLLANGEDLDQELKTLRPKGHSIQCRINAEDPIQDFNPTPGLVSGLKLPPVEAGKIRFETFLQSKLRVPSSYDSLIAKLIVNGKNREEAIVKTLEQLQNVSVEGFPTTINFFKKVFREPMFVSGHHKTNYIELFMPDIKKELQKEVK
jgi:acetyl-CoA carboxylase biotin carboxylase subunit